MLSAHSTFFLQCFFFVRLAVTIDAYLSAVFFVYSLALRVCDCVCEDHFCIPKLTIISLTIFFVNSLLCEVRVFLRAKAISLSRWQIFVFFFV